MKAFTLGIICGIAFGTVDILVMIPLKFENKRKKREAMVGAFIERFMLGFLIPNVNSEIPRSILGGGLGLGLSLPTAIITRTYAPIIGIGIIGGIIIGIITQLVL